MPAITTTNTTILATGANGYVGAWVVHDLLNKGYSVRAAVRTEDKGKHLLETFKQYGDKLKLAVVGNIAADGAFDEAVKGVEGIVHTASPVHTEDGDPKDIIDPAVAGVVGMLNSVLKNATNLQRIVITSSCGAIRAAGITQPTTFSETDWNDAAVKECQEKGAAASHLSKYTASKTVAERAAWSFYENHKSSITWDLAIIHPPLIIGPIIHKVTTPAHLNPSTKMWYGAVLHGIFWPTSDPLTTPGNGWADVRDISQAHVLALETPAAGGERIIVSAGSVVWQDFLDAAKPLAGDKRKIAEGKPGGKKVITTFFDTSKVARIFPGLMFRTVEETTKDTLADFDRRGW